MLVMLRQLDNLTKKNKSMVVIEKQNSVQEKIAFCVAGESIKYSSKLIDGIRVY